MRANATLVDLCDKVRSDPTNAGFLILLALYPNDEIARAIDELDGIGADDEEAGDATRNR